MKMTNNIRRYIGLHWDKQINNLWNKYEKVFGQAKKIFFSHLIFKKIKSRFFLYFKNLFFL